MQHLASVSRGLGRRQLMILRILARDQARVMAHKARWDGLLVGEIARRSGRSAKNSASARSSIRRALAKMQAEGLVNSPTGTRMIGDGRSFGRSQRLG